MCSKLQFHFHCLQRYSIRRWFMNHFVLWSMINIVLKYCWICYLIQILFLWCKFLTQLLFLWFKVFAEGMARELHMQEARIKRIFPCLDELINIHCSFLWRLRQRQRTGKYIDRIGDLLVQQFIGDNAQGLKDAYGQFCSQHKDAVSFLLYFVYLDIRSFHSN